MRTRPWCVAVVLVWSGTAAAGQTVLSEADALSRRTPIASLRSPFAPSQAFFRMNWTKGVLTLCLDAVPCRWSSP